MRKLRRGICKDFDSISHKSKEDMLSVAGITLDTAIPRRHFGRCKPVSAIVACLVFFTFGAILAAAITDLPITQRPLGSGDLFFSDSMGNMSGWTSTYDNIAEAIDRDFYYPTWGVDSELFPYISRQEERNSLQISYQGEIRFFWIDFDANGSTWEAPNDATIYEKYDTKFYIRKGYEYEVAKLGAYHVSGMLDGDLYTFYVDSVENAQAVIDGLQKTRDRKTG